MMTKLHGGWYAVPGWSSVHFFRENPDGSLRRTLCSRRPEPDRRGIRHSPQPISGVVEATAYPRCTVCVRSKEVAEREDR